MCAARGGAAGGGFLFFSFPFPFPPLSLSLCSAFFPLPPLAWRLSPLPICFGLWRLFLRHAFLLARRDETRRGGGASGRVGVREGHRGVDETTGPARGGVGVGGCCSRLVLGALGERQGQPGSRRVARHRAKPKCRRVPRRSQGRSKPSQPHAAPPREAWRTWSPPPRFYYCDCPPSLQSSPFCVIFWPWSAWLCFRDQRAGRGWQRQRPRPPSADAVSPGTGGVL